MHPLAIYQCQFLLQKFNVQNVKEIILSSNVLLNCVSETEDCCTNANFMVWILRVKKEYDILSIDDKYERYYYYLIIYFGCI